MSDTPTATTTLDGLDIDKLLALRRERRRIDAEIAALLDPAGATTLPTWGPCTRCGHVWQGRSQRRPGHCAGCASAYWDKEPVRSTAGKPGTPRAKRSHRRKRRVGLPPLEDGFDIVRLKKFAELPPLPNVETMTPLASDADFIAAIRSALPPTTPMGLVPDEGVLKRSMGERPGWQYFSDSLPPPPAMTPPPPFLVRPTPPPRYVPTVEEPQPESVASRAPTFDDVTQVTLDAAAEELRDVILPPDIDLTEAAPRDLTREYLEEEDADAVSESDDPVVEREDSDDPDDAG